MADVQDLFKEMVSTVLEKGLEAELDEELGYSKYDYRDKQFLGTALKYLKLLK